MANVLPVDFEQPDPSGKAVENIRSVLNSGGVIAFPTDTFYGLGADPFNSEAISKIFHIKQRPADKPLLVLIHSHAQLEDLTREVTENACKLMERFWPGPLTLDFQCGIRPAGCVDGGNG